MEDKDLIENVKKAVNPKFQDWVLFQNGTYIIFDNPMDTQIEEKGLALMKEFGPVFAGSPAGDFEVISLTETEGWVVSGHCYGMYTYVNPDELLPEPTELLIGIYGRGKRDIDGKNPKIIYSNHKK